MTPKPRDVSKIPPAKPRRGGTAGGRRQLRGPSERTAEQREADIAFLAERLLRGLPQRDIAAQLTAARPYNVSREMIAHDAQELTKRWRALAIADIEDAKSEQLVRILELERTAWQALIRLENGTERTVGRTTEYTAKTRCSKSAMKVRDVKDNTAAWLRTLQFCISERSRILGLYAPIKLDAKGANVHFGDVTQNNFLGVNVTITTDKEVTELAKFEVVEAQQLDAANAEDD